MSQLQFFINQTADNGQYKALRKVSYKDIRKRCSHPWDAHFFSAILEGLWEEHGDNKTQFEISHGLDKFFSFVQLIGWFATVFIFFPILLLSKVLQVLFPWIIVGYLAYFNLLFTNQINQFQMVMLGIYIFLQLLLFTLGIHVFRIHWWIWHIHPGRTSVYWYQVSEPRLMEEVHAFYDEMCWYPVITEMMLNHFGDDIGAIIMDYCQSFELESP